MIARDLFGQRLGRCLRDTLSAANARDDQSGPAVLADQALRHRRWRGPRRRHRSDVRRSLQLIDDG